MYQLYLYTNVKGNDSNSLKFMCVSTTDLATDQFKIEQILETKIFSDDGKVTKQEFDKQFTKNSSNVKIF